MSADSSANTNELVARLSPYAISRLGDESLAERYTSGRLHPADLGLDSTDLAAIEPLVLDPLSQEQLRRLPDDHPEHRLQRYVILHYRRPDAARSAIDRLRTRQHLIESVDLSHSARFSAVPSDLLYPAQYGLPLMNFPSAWDVARGHAWVAVLDNGLQTHASVGVHPELASSTTLAFAHRPHFAWNQNYYSAGLPPGYPNPSSSTGVHRVDELRDWPGTALDGQVPFDPYTGHGTHVAGIIAASAALPGVGPQFPSPSNQGIAGTCPTCSVSIHKVSDGSNPFLISMYRFASALRKATYDGNQVVNMSFGRAAGEAGGVPVEHVCPASADMQAVCDSLALASQHHLTLAAAVGNDDTATVLDFPASDSRVIPVGGVQPGPTPGSWERWVEVGYPGHGSNRGNTLMSRGVVAPARDVVSTTYVGREWNWEPFVRCGDSTHPVNGALYRGSYPIMQGGRAGYGTCTGTSMAAPHVAGLVALMRSIDPLMAPETIRNHLRMASRQPNGSTGNTTDFGAGLPNARLAVDRVLATTNRLTPLFIMHSHSREDYFYSTSPQMAQAAYLGRLLPRTEVSPAMWYDPVGTLVRYQGVQYPLPATGQTGLADVWLFTTHVNPASATELLPLFRLSYACADTSPATPHAYCSSNPHKIGHVYATTRSEVLSFQNQGFRYEGIEGYVYPAHLAQPSGTTRLMRAYRPAVHGHVLFPEDRQGYYAGWGYNLQVTTLGYVYRNINGNRPVY